MTVAFKVGSLVVEGGMEGREWGRERQTDRQGRGGERKKMGESEN